MKLTTQQTEQSIQKERAERLWEMLKSLYESCYRESVPNGKIENLSPTWSRIKLILETFPVDEQQQLAAVMPASNSIKKWLKGHQ